MNPKLVYAGATLAFSLAASLPANALPAKRAPLMTRFAAQMNPQNPLPEYPRPQLVRTQWMNLNGVWQYQPGNAGDVLPTNQNLASQICVPFPVESALSGVMEHHDRLWYRRQFTVPAAWRGQQLRLNFGAVDYEAEVFVNGRSVGVHRGGYEAFSYDIAPFLKNQGSGPQELIVRVFDPTDLGGQPRGKQTLNPGGIMYTPTTGIWQTVWLEPVSRTSIQNLHMVPDIDKGVVRVTVNVQNPTPRTFAVVSINDGSRAVQNVVLKPNVETAIPIRNARLWSPDSPFLYNVDVRLQNAPNLSQAQRTLGGNSLPSDRVNSYFGMRKISVGNVGGVPKILLNNSFVFEIGPLDQGFWPDGIYTAPTDEALRFDLATEKQLGFNMVRKHIKVEPARWYYHADKLGMLVWQDMPSPNSYTDHPAPLDSAAYDQQLNSVITNHWNSPAIVMWVVFNESQGRHDTARIVNMAKTLDPSRLVNRDSGAGNDDDKGDGSVGDIDDVHSYPPPAAPRPSAVQAAVCGEFGGIGYIIPGHTWQNKANWGYTTINSAPELENLYGEFAGLVKGLRDQSNLSAAVYTQITDVEVESNGLMTYDRVLKSDPGEIRLANTFRYPLPTYLPVVATSEQPGQTAQTWKYTIQTPPANWTTSAFNDANWQTGQGVFGGAIPGSPPIRTQWDADDIYLRRTFNPGNLSAEQVAQLVVRDIHDDDIEVWINGVSAYKSGGAIHTFENKTISDEAKRAIIPNAPNILAVHCHEAGGDQYVDVGLFRRVPAPGHK